MNKQIEEMAKATMFHCRIDNQCGSCHWSTCNECLAEALYNAGYRKASDVAREIFEEIEKEYGENCGAYRIDDLTYGQLWDFLAELKKKYESEGAE